MNNKAYDELLKQILQLPSDKCELTLDESVRINIPNFTKEIKEIAVALKPWRKGPFNLNELFIDSEWRSFIKFNILKPYLNLKGKSVADVGCNNGYYTPFSKAITKSSSVLIPPPKSMISEVCPARASSTL